MDTRETIEQPPATPARKVLDAQTALHDEYAHPSELLTEYITGFARSVAGGHTGGGKILTDLDGKPHDPEQMGSREVADWMFHPYRPDYGGINARTWCTEIAKDLFQARTYQVTSEMMDVVSATYNKVEAGDTAIITEWDLPSPYGFVWLDKPLTIMDQGMLQLRERAFSWGITTMNIRIGGRDVSEVGLRICTWTHRDDDLADPETLAERKRRLGIDQAAVPIYVDLMSGLSLSHTLVLPIGNIKAREPMGRDEQGRDSTIGWLYALWQYMEMEITTTRQGHVDRPTMRRAQRSLKHQDVSIVVLRRIVPTGDEPVSPRKVDWTCRWIVAGHWRHIESYTGNPHHAIPDRGEGDPVCVTCHRRITRIRPYVKGPDGLPLRAVEHVYRLAR
jgi:hypothetical protein